MLKVSVVVPVHNVEKYLPSCMESLKAQTLDDMEIILVENASTDNSPAMCDEYGKKYDNVKVLHLDFGDLSNARNEGIKVARAEYVGFVDSDDTVEPQMFQDMYDVAEKHKVDMVVCGFLKRYEYRSDRLSYSDTGFRVCSSEEMLQMNFMDQIPQSAWSMLCRKTLFDAIDFPVKRYYEDMATTWKLIRASSRCAFIPKPYYHYWRRPGTIVHTRKFNVPYGHVLADMERIEFINSNPEYSEMQKLELGAKSLAFFYRHFRKMVAYAETDEQKEICRSCRDWVNRLPNGYKLRTRYSRTRALVRNYWRLFCLMERGGTL